jgi:hypothetical protein
MPFLKCPIATLVRTVRSPAKIVRIVSTNTTLNEEVRGAALKFNVRSANLRQAWVPNANPDVLEKVVQCTHVC